MTDGLATPGLGPCLLIHVPIEERPAIVPAVLDEAECLRVWHWVQSCTRVRELVELALELEREGIG